MSSCRKGRSFTLEALSKSIYGVLAEFARAHQVNASVRELSQYANLASSRLTGETLTTAETARVLGVHPDTINNWRKNGRLTGYLCGKGSKRHRYVYMALDVLEFKMGYNRSSPLGDAEGRNDAN